MRSPLFWVGGPFLAHSGSSPFPCQGLAPHLPPAGLRLNSQNENTHPDPEEKKMRGLHIWSHLPRASHGIKKR